MTTSVLLMELIERTFCAKYQAIRRSLFLLATRPAIQPENCTTSTGRGEQDASRVLCNRPARYTFVRCDEQVAERLITCQAMDMAVLAFLMH